ncbi:TIM-barrel domain-containing protein [Massilia endophytica]|uniref:TIM-barrel domain-containing protein n=1 Tax=Massilia endophytica TaxID=2899220 RepID=UPI001E2A7A1D|nr:TIM-barrel domain-containing protein [Massilia endophytica]UGQ48789.1 PA14 domain-containing protein [Massilia endophytica]
MRKLFEAVLAVPLVLAAVCAPEVHAADSTGLDGNGHLLAQPIASKDGFAYTRLKDGVQFRTGGVTKNVLFYGPATVRVNANLGKNYWTSPSLVVVRKPGAAVFELEESADTLTVRSRSLRIAIDRRTGALTFMDGAGRLYTRESAQPQSVKAVEMAGSPSYEVENRFILKPEEAIFGFGYTDSDAVNRRNQDLLLVQTNLGIVIPVMMSSERYGVLWDTYSKMRFQDGPEGARLWAESAPGGVDYYFMGGSSMDDVVGEYRRLTGAAPMFPKQAFGLFMSKERYPTQARIVEVAETFRKERFPLDYIVQDWQYWGSDKDGSWSGMIWDAVRFPDPKGMAHRLHKLNLKLMVSIWPSVGNDTALARELDQHGLRFEPLHWISQKARIYDAYSPKGRQIYFKHVKSGLFDKGVDALWMDGTEVEVGSAAWDAARNEADIKSLGRNALGDFARYLNPYTLLTTQGTYDGQRATSDKRVFTLTRSAWAGAQRTAAASWSGDIFASWDTLRKQVSGGVSVTITGNPYWTQDTGGFFVSRDYPGGQSDPAYRELFARWFQYGAFNPIMRVHGTDIEREPYIFRTLDPEVYRSLLGAAHLRYRLLPYTYGLSAKVTSSHYTLMRALPMDFADDKATYGIDDAFMFGPSLLVHPVTRPMFRMQPPPPATIPADYLRTPDGKPGLAGQYFEGRNFEVPKGQVIDQVIDHVWPAPPLATIPGGLRQLDDFSVRWNGTLEAPEDGEYEIGVEGDDGYRLYLDGAAVIQNWENGGKRLATTRQTLRKGQRLKLMLEYYQATSDRSVRLAWRTPSSLRAMAEKTPVMDMSMRTYLPKGSAWYDFWTNERHEGGQTAVRNVPLDILPLYVRAGAILPLGPVVQYATEQPDAPYEIRIYPGADGSFTLYEDDNETYAYERGQSARVTLKWNDKARTLAIGARQGSFPGMVKSRTLNLVLADQANGKGIGPSPAAKIVRYDGKAMAVTFGGNP